MGVPLATQEKRMSVLRRTCAFQGDSLMRVQELMSQPVVTCHLHDSANAAAKIMWEHDCGVVPVVDDSGRLIGVVTDRAICLAAYFQGAPLSSIRLDSMMSRELCTCRPEDDVTDAEQMMS